jgi:hypothetical protein
VRYACVLALVAAGCGASVKKCKDQTLFVRVTLDSSTAQADQLVVDVRLDGGSPVETQLDHRPGQSGGGIEIEFPSGYPAGHSARVDITANLAGATVGTGGVTIDSLGQGCQSTTLTVSAMQSGNDLAMPLDSGSLDGAADLAKIKPDLYSYDLAGADLVCVPSTEDCFNGVDDDCDGLADCADPDCTGGASPIAACVPDPGSFTAGTTVAGNTSCPGGWPTATPINSNLNNGSCQAGSCSCMLQNDACSGQIVTYSSTTDCSGSEAAAAVPSTDTPCQGLVQIPAGTYYEFLGAGYSGSCNKGGSPSKVAPGWSNAEKFCSGGALGSGCPAGSRCLPAGPNHCVLKAGSQLACPANYTLRTTRYYLDFDDSGRSCACTCSVNTAGSCSGTATVTLWDSPTCNNADLFANAGGCMNNDVHGYNYYSLSGTVTSATCSAPGASESGTTSLNNEQTVCCTN